MGFVDGILAATFAPLILIIGFVLWDKIWTASAIMLNITKSSVAAMLFILVAIFQSFVFQTNPFFNTNSFNLFMLLISSLIGIIIGDNTWLRALALIGTKRVVFVDALKPFLATILAAIFLQENLAIIQIVAIFITMSGVLIVSLEKTEDLENDDEKELNTVKNLDTESIECENNNNEKTNIIKAKDIVINEGDIGGDNDNISSNESTTSKLRKGYILAIINIFLDVIGAIFIKSYGRSLSSFEINFIRFGFAGYSMGLCGILVRKCLPINNQGAIRLFQFPILTSKEWVLVFFGIFCVTFMCPFLTVYSYFYVELPICMTLASLGPVYSVFVVRICKKEKITIRVIIGCVLSIAGVLTLYMNSF